VRETLRRGILTGTIPSGTRLVQAEVAARLQVSTTPVREALRDLVADGLAVFRPHLGVVVRKLDMDELIEVYEIRKALEPLAIARAAQRISAERLAAAADLQARMDAEQEPGAWANLNWQFHAMLEQGADAPLLQPLIENVRAMATLYVAHSLQVEPERLMSGNDEHKALLAALQERDGAKASEILVAHLQGTMEAIVEAPQSFQPES
jgi:DNA-binding GntR family transcriptional regulator